MPSTTTRPSRWTFWLRQAVTLVIVAFAVTWLVRQSSRSVAQVERSGFWQGVLNGAVMPMALPHLLMGHDVPIYAPNNTGRTYKLGYTVGVNACGAMFFGLFFWRVNRWRKIRPGRES